MPDTYESFRAPKPFDLVFIDSCAIDKIRNDCKLNIFFEECKFNLCRSPLLEKEIEHRNTPEETKKPFKGIKWNIYKNSLTTEQVDVRDGIYKIIRGNVKSDKHFNDSMHIFYTIINYGYFISIDNRIIAKRNLVSDYLSGFWNFRDYEGTRFIFTPDEFLAICN